MLTSNCKINCPIVYCTCEYLFMHSSLGKWLKQIKILQVGPPSVLESPSPISVQVMLCLKFYFFLIFFLFFNFFCSFINMFEAKVWENLLERMCPFSIKNSKITKSTGTFSLSLQAMSCCAHHMFIWALEWKLESGIVFVLILIFTLKQLKM